MELIEYIICIIASGFLLCHFILTICYYIGYTKPRYDAVRRSIIDYYGTDDLSKFTPQMLKNLQENSDKFPGYGMKALSYGEIKIVKKKDPPHRIHTSNTLFENYL
jgi:hypothetical protein